MIIRGHRITSTTRLLAGVPHDVDIVLGVKDPGRFARRLREAGFSDSLSVGERVLPRPVGPRTTFNAEGDYLVHRDQPMEVAYRQVEWHWTEFRGRYDRVQRSDIRDVPYKRYPRTFRPPPSVELTIAARADGSTLVVTDPFPRDSEAGVVVHMANVFLEIFGEVEALRADLESFVIPEVRRLNWTVLPPGRHPWPGLRKRLEPLVDEAPERNRPVLFHRLEEINRHGPSFTAVGQGGFRGYVVFGFAEKELFVLESMYYGNATYVFGTAWEELSKLSKAEIIDGNLENARLVHRRGWEYGLASLLS